MSVRKMNVLKNLSHGLVCAAIHCGARIVLSAEERRELDKKLLEIDRYYERIRDLSMKRTGWDETIGST